MYIENFGYNPLLAADGDTALRLAAEHPEIQVIMLDVVMSGISGSELSMQLSALLPEASILFCSGHPLEALLRLGIEAPAARFIQKPCHHLELKERLSGLFAPRLAA
ncbi:MAG: response regulator [Verrucomicrobiota bacterium]|nr:response regulator [Verrucomicrobiota bacterium]